MGDDYSIEKLLAKATNPLDPQPDKEAVKEFCSQISKEDDGYQTALRFLAHKIQSPQEGEALHSLLVLEECVKSCGSSFHSEVGKFRFLNELIKVVSPKYLGNRASPKVKTKVIELMFKWSVELKQEPKIFEAYQMLKRQGVVTEDPVHIIQHCEPPPPPRAAKTAFFEDEETSEMLQKLLRSRNPQDLQAANRLIKNMVKDADKRMERTARRITELEMGQNNAKVLSDMLRNYKSKETSLEERELMKDLFDCCERLRPKLFRLAGEMDEKDEGLGDILKANDDLTTVINTYKKLVLGQDVGPVVFLADRNPKSETSLLDLASPTEKRGSQCVDSSLLDDQLLALGLSDSKQNMSPHQSPSSVINGVKTSSDLEDLDKIFSVGNSKTEITNSGFGILTSQVNGAGVGSTNSIAVRTTVGISSSAPVSATPAYHRDENIPKLLQPINTKSPVPICTTHSNDKNSIRSVGAKGLEELDVLSQSLLKKSLPANAPTKSEFPSAPQKIPMNQLPKQPQVQTPSSPSLLRVNYPQDSNPTVETENRVPSISPSKVSVQDVSSLSDVTVPLQSIQPGETPPLTLQEKNGLTVVVHFGKDSPRADVTVMVVSTMSRNSCPVKSFYFQAAVPKTMRIKLQPPSATDLPPYNPILPPAAITQVMLLANPNKEKVRLKYKVTYIIEEQTYTDIGEVYNLLEHR